MTHSANGPELTAYERELLADPGQDRGYVPADGIPEPTQGPTEPASASPPGATGEPAEEPPQ